MVHKRLHVIQVRLAGYVLQCERWYVVALTRVTRTLYPTDTTGRMLWVWSGFLVGFSVMGGSLASPKPRFRSLLLTYYGVSV